MNISTPEHNFNYSSKTQIIRTPQNISLYVNIYLILKKYDKNNTEFSNSGRNTIT